MNQTPDFGMLPTIIVGVTTLFIIIGAIIIYQIAIVIDELKKSNGK